MFHWCLVLWECWSGLKVTSVVFNLLPTFFKWFHQGQELSVFVRCFVELALASNAPTPLKTQVCLFLAGNLIIKGLIAYGH